MSSNDVTTRADLASLRAATEAATVDLANLKAKLAGFQSARPAFIAANTFADAKIYDQDIADTKLAIEQGENRLARAQKSENDAIYKDDQDQKRVNFAVTNLTNTIFWSMFEEEYEKATDTILGLIEAASTVISVVSKANRDQRPDGASMLTYPGLSIDLISKKIRIPNRSGTDFYFNHGRQLAPFADGTDPSAEFLSRVNDKVKAIIQGAAAA